MRLAVLLAMLFWLPWTTYAQWLGEPGLRWYTLQTEHFRITFPLGLEGLAHEAAVAAENAYQYLLKQFGYAPSEKTDIVLCDALDTAHRELDIFQNRLTICVAQGDMAERFNPKFPSWVGSSVFALYAQLASADLVFGFSEVLRPLLGKLVLPNLKSSELLAGIGEYLAEEALSTPPDVRPGVGGGHGLVRYLVERFGPDFLKEWHHLRANDPWATLTLGLWSDDEKIFRRLTSSPLSLPLSPRRERGDRGVRGQRGAESGTLFIKHDIHKHSYLYGDLYLYVPKTKREMRLTEGARIYRAALFPDGQKVLLARYRWGDHGPVLAIFDLKTNRMETLKEFPLHDYFIDSFAVSPDGEAVALSIWRRGGFQDIYLLDLSPSPSLEERGESPFPLGKGLGDRSKLKPITRDRAVDLSPAFSPDGHFVLFLSDRDGSFKPYGYRIADGAFFEVIDASDPNGWKPVQLELEPFPPWDGFPETEYPITSYDPRPSLEPKILVPLPGASSLSLLTFGSDALRQHRYSVLLGFNWKTLQPSYSVHYENRVLLASLETLLRRDGNTAHQSVAATLPIITNLSTRQSLSLFYRRDEEEFISHQIGLGWNGSWKVFHNWFEVSLWGVTQTRTGQRRWENHLGFRLAGTTPLPLNLRGSIFAEWGEGRSPLLGAELQFSPDVALRLGLLWDAERQSVKFYLR
jgi:hypothetical protein